MRLEIPERDFSSNTQNSSNSFTVKASAKAFDILSSGIYSDKPKAIVRELVCNAYDSHKEAGKMDTPFHVHVPSEIYPYFYVEDFGLGLSTQDVIELYTTYFHSTKTNSNDVIGALGLGSKSPFAYTDTFTIESTYDGVRSSFVAYKDAAGMPMINELGSVDVDAPNGVKVQVAIDDSDFRLFRDKIQTIMKVFDREVYQIINDERGYATPEFIEPTYIHENLKFYKGRGNVNAIMGNISYPINISIIDPDSCGARYIKNTYLSRMGIDIHFNIGDLDISASREELGYDQRTIDNINEQFRKIEPFIKARIQEEIDSADNWFNACVKGINILEYFGNCNNIDEYSYNFIPLKKHINIEKSWGWLEVYDLKRTSGYNIARGDASKAIHINSKTKVFINDIGRGVYPILNHNYDSYASANSYIVTFKHDKYLFDDGVEERFEQFVLGGHEVILLSSLERPPKEECEEYKKTLETEMREVKISATLSSGDAYNAHKYKLSSRYGRDGYDLDLGGIYILTSRGKPDYDNFFGLLNAAYEMGIIDNDMPVYTCPKSVYRYLKKNTEWIAFDDYIKLVYDEVDNLDFKSITTNYAAYRTLSFFNNMEEERIELFNDSESKGGLDITGMNPLAKLFFEMLNDLKSKSDAYLASANEVNNVKSLTECLGKDWVLNKVDYSKNDIKVLTSCLNMIYNQFPILTFVNNGYISGDEYEQVARAIESLLKA